MSVWLIFASIAGVGVGTAAAYGATHSNWTKQIHFVKRDNLRDELAEFEIDIGEGEVCAECGDRIDPEQIGAVIREGDSFQILCGKRSCLDIHDLNQESLEAYAGTSP